MNMRLFKRADFLLLLAVLAVAALLFGLKGRGDDKHLTAFVYEGNNLVDQVDLTALSQPEQFPCADGKVTVAVRPGAAQIVSAECPTQTCVRTGALTKSGDTAVCVPNQVTVVLRSGGAQHYQTY